MIKINLNRSLKSSPSKATSYNAQDDKIPAATANIVDIWVQLMDYLRKINDRKADDDKENFQPSRTLFINIYFFVLFC